VNELDPLLSAPATPVLPAGASTLQRHVTDRITARPTLEKVARDFESVLLQKLLDEMRRTIPESGLLESATSDQVQGLFWHYLAEDAAEKGGLGLAKELMDQFQWTPGGAAPAAQTKGDS